MITPLVITWHSESQLGGISGGINLNLALKALVGKGVRVSPKHQKLFSSTQKQAGKPSKNGVPAFFASFASVAPFSQPSSAARNFARACSSSALPRPSARRRAVVW